MNSRSIQLNNTMLAYTKFGRGAKILVCFHGYGQTGQNFKYFENTLGETHTIFAIDLFFHGKSTWGEEEVILEKAYLIKIFVLFLTEEQISKFSILGFSMGGRFAIAIAEGMPEKIDSLILAGAEGIKNHTFYTIATFSKVTRWLFKKLVLSRFLFKWLVKVASSLYLFPKQLAQLYENETKNVEQRWKVYNTWVTFRKLKFDISTLVLKLNEHPIKVIIVTGKYDKIIKANRFKVFEKKLKSVCHLELNCGHGSLLKHLSESIDFKGVIQ